MRKCPQVKFSSLTLLGSLSFPCNSSVQWSSLKGSPRQYLRAGMARLISSSWSVRWIVTMSWALSANLSFSFSVQALPKSSRANMLTRKPIQSIVAILSSSSVYSRSIFQLLEVAWRSVSTDSRPSKRGSFIPKLTQFSLNSLLWFLRPSNSFQKLSSLSKTSSTLLFSQLFISVGLREFQRFVKDSMVSFMSITSFSRMSTARSFCFSINSEKASSSYSRLYHLEFSELSRLAIFEARSEGSMALEEVAWVSRRSSFSSHFLLASLISSLLELISFHFAWAAVISSIVVGVCLRASVDVVRNSSTTLNDWIILFLSPTKSMS
mmetsp:Transcript_20030/g.41902  ORF Transcript_20030/g.41902 Transcript_20030/m.41902 type:complete len:323 (-) Transcript_20030:2216-3184(-)